MKAKLVVTAALIALGAIFVNSYVEKKATRDAEKAEASRVEARIKASISQIAARHNAVSDWEEKLSGGEYYRLSPILTVELERLWLAGQPILFSGAIKDISSADANTYHVMLEQSIYDTRHMFATELRLLVSAQRSVIDSFLQRHPELLAADLLNNGVAVVANLESIGTSYELDGDGERIEVKTGKGRLLDIIFTGGVFF